MCARVLDRAVVLDLGTQDDISWGARQAPSSDSDIVEPAARSDVHSLGVRVLAKIPNSSLVLSTGTNGPEVALWDSLSGTMIGSLEDRRGKICIVLCSLDGRFVCLQSVGVMSDGEQWLWDLRKKTMIARFGVGSGGTLVPRERAKEGQHSGFLFSEDNLRLERPYLSPLPKWKSRLPELAASSLPPLPKWKSRLPELAASSISATLTAAEWSAALSQEYAAFYRRRVDRPGYLVEASGAVWRCPRILSYVLQVSEQVVAVGDAAGGVHFLRVE